LILKITENTGVADKVPYIIVNLIAIAFCLWLLSPILRRLLPSFFRLITLFCRWFFTWQTFRRILITLAVLTTLIAIFYTEEDWRGKLAWENCKRELEAQGMVLDWNKFIPPPVPDDQNFYTFSTNILLRFKQVPGDDGFYSESKRSLQLQWLKLYPLQTNGVPVFPIFDTSKSGPIVVAKIIVSREIETNLPAGANTFVVTLDDAEAANRIRDRIREIIRAKVGRSTLGVEGFPFSEFQFTNLPLVQIFVRASTPASVGGLNTFCPSDAIGKIGKLQVVTTTDQNTFDILLTDTRVTAAADYLKWSDQFVPAFNDIREALKRPYAILPGDYSQPYRMPIPDFVASRALAQTLAQRAQCYFLLGEPDKALPELALIHDFCRILEKPPTGKPETLLEAMINVAITSLYEQIIHEGFQRHAWQEPQLVVLQAQLAQINLPPYVFEAFREMPAHVARNAEIMPPQLRFSSLALNAKTHWLTKATLRLMPRGWVYQNIINTVLLDQLSWSGFDPTNGTISPQNFETSMDKVQTRLEHHSPYYLLADIAFPNYSKAWQTTAYNQTMVNEAQIACALERYRLVHGEYPEMLDALVPQFMQTIPHDLIGGQPLHYRRTDDGKFLLYSVGWNETDDGGQPSPHKENGGIDFTNGDWVWPN